MVVELARILLPREVEFAEIMRSTAITIKAVVQGSAEEAQWNSFVEKSANGTLFHRMDFLAYHPAERFSFTNLMFFRNEKLVAVLPGGVANGCYRSPMGASFGGFVYMPGISLALSDSILKSFTAWCGNNGIKSVRLTPPMHCYCTSANEAMEYAMRYNGFIQKDLLYSSVIDLTRVRTLDYIPAKSRYSVRKAHNMGIEIIESDDFEAAYPILVENKKKFSILPTHTLDELRWLKKTHGKRITLVLARYHNEVVGGQVLFDTNRHCTLLFYMFHLYKYRTLHTVNALVYDAMKRAIAGGKRWLDYGVSADTLSTNPLEPSWSLVHFKESVGCTGCIRRTYELRLD